MTSMDDVSVHYSEIDVHIKEAPADVGTSFLRLKDYILSACQPGKRQTLFLFRGIFIWLLNNYTRAGLDPTEESPISLIREYQFHNITINSVIDAICRIFDVPSTTVHGISKPLFNKDVDQGYVDTRDNKRCSWNAINIDGKWFLLNTNILFPPEEKNNSRDATGNRNRTEQTRSLSTGPGISFDPFWFLTDPKDFIFFCYPEEPTQQHLPSADLVEYGDFLKGPILHPGFFRYKLDIVSDKVCHILSKDGLCFISLYTDKTIAMTLSFSCDIWSVTGSEANKLTADESSRTVRWFRSADMVTFKFVFSDKGRYRAVLSCQDVKTDLLERCCEFEIDCEKKYTGERPRLPKCVSITGFGIGPTAVKAGLMSSSQKYPVVLVNSVTDQTQGAPGKISKEYCLKFQISEEAIETYSYDTRLCSFDNLGREQEYKGCANSKISEKRSEMEVRVKIPAKNIDYVLSIRATEKGCRDNGKVPPVCSYLLRTSLDDQEEMEIKKAEKNIKQIKKQRSLRILKDVQSRLEEEVHRLKGEIKQLKEVCIYYN